MKKYPKKYDKHCFKCSENSYFEKYLNMKILGKLFKTYLYIFLGHNMFLMIFSSYKNQNPKNISK
jgi:hypothetical protein